MANVKRNRTPFGTRLFHSEAFELFQQSAPTVCDKGINREGKKYKQSFSNSMETTRIHHVYHHYTISHKKTIRISIDFILSVNEFNYRYRFSTKWFIEMCVCVCVCWYAFVVQLNQNRRGGNHNTSEMEWHARAHSPSLSNDKCFVCHVNDMCVCVFVRVSGETSSPFRLKFRTSLRWVVSIIKYKTTAHTHTRNL